MDFPDVRQQFSYDCGPACARAVAQRFGVPAPAVRCSTKNGATRLAICEGLEAVGLVAQSGYLDGQDLKYHIRRGRCVIVMVEAGGEGHYVVAHMIRGSKVSIHDPDSGPRVEPLAEFVRKWRRKGGVGIAVGL